MRCQVYLCQRQATVRCTNGFRYCERHAVHNHTDTKGRTTKAKVYAITPEGEWVRRGVVHG